MTEAGYEDDGIPLSQQASRAGERQRKYDYEARHAMHSGGLRNKIKRVTEAYCEKYGSPSLKKDGNSVHSKYATYEGILMALTPLIHAQALSTRLYPERLFSFGSTMVLDVCLEVQDTDTGDFLVARCPIPLNKADAQAIGSAMTYGARYLYKGTFSLTDGELDDNGDSLAIKDISDQALTQGALDLMSKIEGLKTQSALSKWRAEDDTRRRFSALPQYDQRAVYHAYQSAYEAREK